MYASFKSSCSIQYICDTEIYSDLNALPRILRPAGNYDYNINKHKESQTEWDWEDDLAFYTLLSNSLKKGKSKKQGKTLESHAPSDYIDFETFNADTIANDEALLNIFDIDINSIRQLILFGPPRILQILKESLQHPLTNSASQSANIASKNDATEWPSLGTEVVDYVNFLYNVTKTFIQEDDSLQSCPFCGQDINRAEDSSDGTTPVIPKQWCCAALRNVVFVARNASVHAQKHPDVARKSSAVIGSGKSKNGTSAGKIRTTQLPDINRNKATFPQTSTTVSPTRPKVVPKAVDKGGCKITSFQDTKGKLYKSQMISYALSSEICMQQGWTVNPGHHLPSNIQMTSQKKRQKLHSFKVKRYDDNSLFCVKFPDGSASVLHPNGIVAITVLATHSSSADKTENLLKDYEICEPSSSHYIISSENGALMGAVSSDGNAFMYYPDNSIRLSISPLEVLELDAGGAKRRHWWWYELPATSPSQSASNPPPLSSRAKPKNLAADDRETIEKSASAKSQVIGAGSHREFPGVEGKRRNVNEAAEVEINDAVNEKAFWERDLEREQVGCINCPIIFGVTGQLGFRMHALDQMSLSFLAAARHTKFNISPNRPLYPVRTVDANLESYINFIKTSKNKIKKLLKKLSSLSGSFQLLSFEQDANELHPPLAASNLLPITLP